MRTPSRNSDNEDSLNRKNEIELFKKILQNAVGPYVISIDAPWGTGKTYFTKCIKNEIEDEIKSIYINAWESDYNVDPLITIISELKKIIPPSDFDSLKDKYISVSKLVLPTAIKLATSAIIDFDKITDSISEIGEKVVLKKIEDYESEKESIEHLKSELKAIAENINLKKIVVFIDELDRCRPNYAIEFLERVKHFFDLEGYIFVLSIDEAQLLESIKVLYGLNFEAEKYLRRFIDYKYILKSKIQKKYVENIVRRIGLDEIMRKHLNLEDYIQHFINIITYLSQINKLTARDINQIVSQINLTFITLNKGTKIQLCDLLITLVFLKYKNKKLYYEFVSGNISPDEVLKELLLCENLWDTQFIKYNTRIVSWILGTAKVKGLKSKMLDKLDSLTKNEDISDTDRNKKYALQVMDNLNRHSEYDYVEHLSKLKQYNL
jgi:hypothetical protein